MPAVLPREAAASRFSTRPSNSSPPSRSEAPSMPWPGRKIATSCPATSERAGSPLEDSKGMSPPAEQLLGHRRHPLRLEAKVLLQLLERCRGAERLHADDFPLTPHVALPTESRGLLHRDASLHLRRQDAVAVLARLLLEDVPGRHGHHPRANALGEQRLVCRDGQAELAAGGNQHHLRLAAGRV